MHAIDESYFAAMKTKQPLQACLLTAPRQAERCQNSHGAPGYGITVDSGSDRRLPSDLSSHGRNAKPCALLQRRSARPAPPAALAGTTQDRLWSAQLAALLHNLARMARRLGSGKTGISTGA